MALVNAKEMLTKAKAGHYAVGQFNINNLEWTKAILLTAQEMNSPVILGVSEGAGKYMCGYKTVTNMVKAMIEELGITVPVALHLDHGSYEGAKKCIEAGFSSITTFSCLSKYIGLLVIFGRTFSSKTGTNTFGKTIYATLKDGDMV